MCFTDAEIALGDSRAPLGHSVIGLEDLSGLCWCFRKLKMIWTENYSFKRFNMCRETSGALGG